MFPFKYEGRLYYQCTTVDHGLKEWCATTSDYDVDGLWGNCAGESPCPFVFVNSLEPVTNLNIILYTERICSTPSTACITYTIGGNANGAICNFPFVYKDVLFSECITLDNKGVLWCSTTYNYDVNKLWGNCDRKNIISRLNLNS